MQQEREAGGAGQGTVHDFHDKALPERNLDEVRATGRRILIPSMGPGSETMAACLRGMGVPAECLPFPDQEALRLGRRYTSGKECLPMSVTLGNLLKRVQKDEGGQEKYIFLMPHTHGPCRFGNYNLLNQIVFERLGWQDRISLWSPRDSGYFVGTPPGFSILLFTGFMVSTCSSRGCWKLGRWSVGRARRGRSTAAISPNCCACWSAPPQGTLRWALPCGRWRRGASSAWRSS